jgi:hypothetical protein
MSAAITEFVDVTVVAAGASPTRFSFGNYMGVFTHTVGAVRMMGPYTSVAAVVAAGFTLAAEPEVYYWATSVFSQDDAVNQIYIGQQSVGDAGDWTVTMDAIEAYAITQGLDWYGTSIESRTSADIVDVAAWSEARVKTFIYQSSDADVLTGAPGNINDLLNVAGYKRSMGMYHATGSGAANGYLDGAWASSGYGMNLDSPGGRGIWAYRALEGITFDPVTSTQASAVYADFGNIYGRNLGLSFTSKGTTAFGTPYFMDIQTTIDWIKTRLEEDILALFVAQNVIPYTNSGINLVRATVKARLDQGVTFGHFSPDVETEVIVPNVADVSTAAKQARELTISATATFAGGIQKLFLTLNLSF